MAMTRFVIGVMVALLLLGQSASARAQQDLGGGIQDLVRQMMASMEQQQKRKLAILDFTRLDGSVDNFGGTWPSGSSPRCSSHGGSR
jgi:Sec-independent protein translocase protein TatA